MKNETEHILIAASKIISSYVKNNNISDEELINLIGITIEKINLIKNNNNEYFKNEKSAIDPEQSINENFISCIECGKQFKSLKNHLNKSHNLTPEKYKEKWNLPADYPMVTSEYSARRSKIAVNIRLGRL
ncbi:MucR family transcriptional regulator [Brucellaceae bacterium C25G]